MEEEELEVFAEELRHRWTQDYEHLGDQTLSYWLSEAERNLNAYKTTLATYHDSIAAKNPEEAGDQLKLLMQSNLRIAVAAYQMSQAREF